MNIYMSIVKYRATNVKKNKNFKITKNHDNAEYPLLHNQLSKMVHNGINTIELNICVAFTSLNKDAINPVAAKIK
jgi:hypothetical protein